MSRSPNIQVLAVIIALVASVSSGWAQPDSSKTVELALHSKVASHKSCVGDADVYSEVLDLVTYYTNMGHSPVSLFLGSGVATRIRISKTIDDLKAGKLEVEFNGDVFPKDGNSQLLGQNPKLLNDSREILPGETVEDNNSAAILVRRLRSSRIPGTVAAGIYFLEMHMLVKIAELPSKVDSERRKPHHPKERWVSVVSDPIEIEIPNSPELINCSKASE